MNIRNDREECGWLAHGDAKHTYFRGVLKQNILNQMSSSSLFFWPIVFSHIKSIFFDRKERLEKVLEHALP